MNWKTLSSRCWRAMRTWRGGTCAALLTQTMLQPLLFVFVFGRVMTAAG